MFTNMYRFGVEIEVQSMDLDEFKRCFRYPCTDCQILDFQECAMDGIALSCGMRYHIEGCVGCGSDMHNYFHIIRDYGEPPLIEIVTPVLNGCEGFRLLQHVCDCLQRANAKINSRCGLHIHVDAQTMSLNHIISIICEYQKMEDVIDKKMRPERRNSQCKYAKSLREYNFGHIKTFGELLSTIHSRNYKINVQSLTKYGSLEFRQHHGSVCYDEIRSWIFFIMLLCERMDPKWGGNARELLKKT